MNWLADRVTRHPWVVIVAFLAVTATAAVKLPSLTVSFTYRAFYDYPGNADVAILDRYLAEFGDDAGFVGVLLEGDELFTAPVLRYIQEVSRALERKPIFRRVRSLSVNQVPRGDGDEVVTGPLFEEVPATADELAKIRKLALASHLVVPRLLSRDGRYTVVAAEMRTPACVATLDEQREAVDTVKAVLKKLAAPAGVRVQVGGAPAIESETKRVLEADQRRFGAVALVLIVVTLLLVFGSLHGLLLPLTNVLLSVAWVVGVMAWTGSEINLVSSIIPTILLVYGLIDSIFMMTRYYELIDQGLDRRQAAKGMVVGLSFPCLLTSVTTAAGFAAFAIGTTPMMERFGIFLALGAIFAYLASILWLPAILSVVPAPRRGFRRRGMMRFTSALLERVKRALAWRRWIAATALVLFVLATLAAVGRTVISGQYFGILPQDTESVQASKVMSAVLGGISRTALVIEGPPGSMQEPDVLRAMAHVDRWSEGRDIVQSSISLADLVAAMNQAFHGGDAKHYRIPDSKALVAQYLALLDPHTRSEFVSNDYSRTHIRILSKDKGTHLWQEFASGLRSVANEQLGRYELAVTGYGPTAYPAVHKIVTNMIWSFLLAFAFIVLAVLVAYRSLRLALLSIVPNLLPVMALMAVLALTDTWLWIGEATILCITVGIVFDNSIHLYSRVAAARAAGQSNTEAVVDAVNAVGPPIVFTSVLITLGFGIFLLSDFVPLRILGLGCVVTILIGLVADLLLSNSLLLLFGQKCFRQGQARTGNEAPAEAGE